MAKFFFQCITLSLIINLVAGDLKLINKTMEGKKRLGIGPHHWEEDDREVRLSLPRPSPILVKVQTEGKSIQLDLRTTALIIVDMQNDFCSENGWLSSLGLDWSRDRAPIDPLLKLIPALRKNSVRIIWLNWGNRKDLANMPPNQMWTSYNVGDGHISYGDKSRSGAPILEKDSWGAAVVDELKAVQSGEDVFVDKFRFSGFWDTQLDSILKNLGVENILFAGVNTDQCVLHTLADANFLGYGCILVKDCVATTSPDYCAEATFYNVKNSFGFLTNSDWVMEGLNKVVK